MPSRRAKRIALKALRLAISYIVLIVMAAWSVLPLYYIIMTSFSNVGTLVSLTISTLIPKHITLEAYRELLTGRFMGGIKVPNFPLRVLHNIELALVSLTISTLIPKHITLEAYRELLTGRFTASIKVPNFPLWVLHSIELAGATALFSVALAMLAGYALSRLDMPAKKSLATFIYIITFLPTTATTVPLYLLFARFHLLNYAGLVLAYTPGTAVFAAFLAKLSIDAIPPDYEEAAMIDGLSRFGAFVRIVFRLALPVVALTALLGFLGAYMDYATAYAFIGGNSNAWTAMLGLWYLAGLYNYASAPAYNIFAAGAVLMGIPLMALFLVSQKMMTRAYSSLAGIK